MQLYVLYDAVRNHIIASSTLTRAEAQVRNRERARIGGLFIWLLAGSV